MLRDKEEFQHVGKYLSEKVTANRPDIGSYHVSSIFEELIAIKARYLSGLYFIILIITYS
jgi:hypothetical protein